MIGPVDYILNIEREARESIAKGDLKKGKEKLDNIIEFIKNTDFLTGEMPDLLIALKKVNGDYLKLRNFGSCIDTLYIINTKIKKINLENDLIAVLKEIPKTFDIIPYLEKIQEMSKGSQKIAEIMKEFKSENTLTELQKKVSIDKNNMKSENIRDDRLDKTRKLINEGKREEALKLINAYISENPNDAEAIKLKNSIISSIENEIINKLREIGLKEDDEISITKKMISGNLKEADEMVTKILLNNRNPNIWLIKGYISMMSGNKNYENFIAFAKKINPEITKSKLYELLFVKNLIL
ncbi:MAG: hypothetical protein ACP5E8_02785 [Thermoplasmata archaeon]